MSRHATDALPRAVPALVLALLLALAVMPPAGYASPSSIDSQIDEKDRAREAAKAEIVRMQDQLAAQETEYISIGQRIQQTQLEISKAQTEAVDLATRLGSAQDMLDVRAVALYQTDPLSMLDLLLTSESVSEFIVRADAIMLIGESDATLIDEVEGLQSENVSLQRDLDDRMAELTALEAEADRQREEIDKGIDLWEAKVHALGEDIATLLRRKRAAQIQGSDPSGSFTPDTVISESNFRAYGSMSASDIQGFLDRQPGSLKHLRTADHNGRSATAAQMIAEASATWKVSPKVILATLQKEQSLLTDPSPSQHTLDWAMGCGATDSGRISKYRGFGKQIYWGAQKFDKNAKLWHPGITKPVDGSVVHPTNPGTHAQYMYTPHFHGVRSFWRLYWRYFGDPKS